MSGDMSGSLTSIAEEVFRGRQREADKRIIPLFEMRAVENVVESERQARPIFEEVPYIRILVPGDQKSQVHRPVWDDRKNPNSDTARFPEQWKAFQEGRKHAPSGTPLEMWPLLTRARVLELKALEVTTVEQLADLDDGVVGRYMGLTTLKQAARDHIARAKDDRVVVQMRSELNDRDARISTLEKQLKDMSEQIEKLAKSKK